MTLVLQSPLRPTEMLLALDLVANSRVSRFRAAVAYTTLGGCRAVFGYLAARIPNWQQMPKELITSLDFGLTEPDALRHVAALPNFVVRIAPPVATSSFHPKLFIFDSGTERHLLVGSANLSARAFDVNTEAALVGQSPTTYVDGYWSTLVGASVALTQAILEDYRRQRRRRPPVLRIDPVLVVPQRPAPTDQEWFWSAVESGALVPTSFEAFWVEAGSMKSGGAHNQLELPRGASRFFGFNFRRYDPRFGASAAVPIGAVDLFAGPRSFPGRQLTWHSHNRMERLNLPTLKQGGLNYAGKVVLFRRRQGRFEIVAADPENEQAAAWRNASTSAGVLYRVSERPGVRANRLCGVF